MQMHHHIDLFSLKSWFKTLILEIYIELTSLFLFFSSGFVK